jgi:hypothetical protein
MLRKLTLHLFTLCLLVGVFACSRKSPEVKVEANGISVKYGQPSKKGRVIFGDLVPFGKVWRTGANEATEISFSRDVIFGGQSIKSGTYTLFTIPEAEKWTIILNSVTGQWGAYKYNPEKDVLKIEVPVQTLENEVESFLIAIDDKGLSLAWDKTRVSVPIE